MWFWLFIVGVLLNLFLVLYIRWLLQNISLINQENSFINEEVLGFVKHIESINELEMFYGDETLQSLIQHGNALSARLVELDLITNEKTTDQPDELEKT